MRFIDFISVRLSFFLIFGILLGFWIKINLFFSLLLLVGLLISLFIAFQKQRRNAFPFFGLLALITTCALGLFVTSLSREDSFKNHYSHYLSDKHQAWQLKINEVLKPTRYSNRYFVKVSLIDGHSATGKMLLTLPKDSSKAIYAVDDGFLVLGKAAEIQKPLNPHQFDYRAYLNKKGIYHQIKTKQQQIKFSKDPTKTLKGTALNFREHIIVKLRKADFGKEELGVIQALLLGQRNDISESTYDDYKKAGAVHILAVSGLHVGILLLILQFILKPLERLPKGKTIKLVVIVLLLWSFAFIAGLSPSIVRAVTMFSFIAYALHLNRPTNMFNIMAWSMFFILLVKPLFLFEVGFQMSYAAVFAIVWIYPKLQRFWYPKNWLIQKLWQLFSVSIAAQLGVLPLSLFYFHQFPSLFFISNLVVVPFLGVILGLGILVIALGLFNVLPQILVAGYNFLIKAMNSVIGWVAQQEGFLFQEISFDRIQMLLLYILIFGLVFTLSKPKFKNLALFLLALSGLSAWGLYNQFKFKQQEQLILAHQTKNTVLLYQNGAKLKLYAFNIDAAERIVTDFKISERIISVGYDKLENSYSLNKKEFFIVNNAAILPQKVQIDYLLLTQSPKINLTRVIDSIKPKFIIADGSNYTSYVNQWKATCTKKKIPFHYTGEKGAYYFVD